MPALTAISRARDICDLAPGYIRAIAPYQPGKPVSELARELGFDPNGIVKLASNENPLGVSPLAMQAMRQALADVARYPDGNGFELKQALSRRHGVDMAQIVLGNGSNDVLELAARAFLAPGIEAVYSQHTFAVYPLATQAIGATGVEVPARDFAHDIGAMLKAISPRTRLVFLANPNNPTGTLIRGADLHAFLGALPPDVIVVLDEAYNEYLPADLRADSVGWLREFPNLIITRTFSKVYGLAGLRVGYAFAHAGVADLMNRVRQPFNVNSLALAAATAGLDDSEFVRRSFELNQAGMRRVIQGLARLGLTYIPSFGNFVSFKVKDAGGVFRRLLERGVIVRPIASYGMPDYLRVTIGLESENERFLESLKQALAG
ncbi:MAG: histidinol-phosphate transaminase [Betaproteobacteria bacterium]|nr:histidinol-phosphate transaminase [Betaproteobacteria bacterium]